MELWIVVPCYDECEALPRTSERLEQLLARLVEDGRIAPSSRVLYVDDGSRDGTWNVIEAIARASARAAGIKLSRNRGHQNALFAGLLIAGGDAVISLDADLQDDIAAIDEMLERHAAGHDIVYGVRRSRVHDTWFKRATARLFYGLARWSNPDTIPEHADFRLMSRRAVEELRRFREVNLYLRGMVTLIGLPSTTVAYDRREREAGRTKYPLRRMIAFAFDGLSSFSALPLRAITALGALSFLGCFAIAAWALYVRLFTDRAVPGWASTVLPLSVIGAVQILCLGVVGEYLAKIYSEIKDRPRFIVEKTVGLPAAAPPAVAPRGGATPER